MPLCLNSSYASIWQYSYIHHYFQNRRLPDILRNIRIDSNTDNVPDALTRVKHAGNLLTQQTSMEREIAGLKIEEMKEDSGNQVIARLSKDMIKFV